MKDVGARGQVLDRRVEKYAREALENLASIKSGERVEVELVIEKMMNNDFGEEIYTYKFRPVVE